MQYLAFDLPPEDADTEEAEAADLMPEMPEPDYDTDGLNSPGERDFPTLTDCPYCGARNAQACGCFD